MSNPHRFGFIALCGAPNVGKSTLLNRIIGEKISIISRRPQTTRHRILGIKTLPNAQLVFVDTPGLHRNQNKGLNRAINRTALNSASDADLIVFMIDYRGWTGELKQLFSQVSNHDSPVILVINKIDRLKDSKQILPLIEKSAEFYPFKEIIPLSVLKQSNLSSFVDTLIAAVPEGEPGFPADQQTDRSQRFLASEFLREQTFRMLGKELPYASAVEVTKFEYKDDQLLNVMATIWVEKSSQKAIIIGKEGKQLKAIAQNARKQMEKSFSVKVYLEVWVKVRKGWADNAVMLRLLGYEE